MKQKSELIKEAKGYFEKYPKADEVYTTGDGNFFLESNASAAKTHARKTEKKLITITRLDCEDGAAPKTEAPEVVIPEGEPSKDWTKAELIALGARDYPDVKLTKSMKEDTILGKLADAKKAKEEAEAEKAKADAANPAEGADKK